MPTTKPIKAFDPNESVSNELAAAAAITKNVEAGQFAGEGAVLKATSEVEPVQGYKPLKALGTSDLEMSDFFSIPPDLDLPDVAIASFGLPPPLAETVHGVDNRKRISPCTSFPWRAIASLLITAKDGKRYVGTGWFVGPHTLLTAGHCVFAQGQGWMKSIEVMPGRDGSSLPYGKATSTCFKSVKGWTEKGDQNHDYGAIILSTDLGKKTGWFGYGYYTDSTLTASTGNISGYPADKPSGTQWFDARKIDSVGSHKVYYDIDTFGGQSGSPVWLLKSGNRYGIAVHCYGGSSTNSGTRITKEVYDNIKKWVV